MKNREGIIKGICLVSIGFISGGVFMAPGTDVADKVEKYNIVLQENKELKERLMVSDKKLKEAQPYFDLQTEQQLEMEKEVLRLEEERLNKEKEEKTITLGSGNYESGKDFEPGKYDIVAVSGNGNVYTDNLYNGGINALMGVGGSVVGDLYVDKYENIDLSKDVKLTIDRVTVKLIPAD